MNSSQKWYDGAKRDDLSKESEIPSQRSTSLAAARARVRRRVSKLVHPSGEEDYYLRRDEEIAALHGRLAASEWDARAAEQRVVSLEQEAQRISHDSEMLLRGFLSLLDHPLPFASEETGVTPGLHLSATRVNEPPGSDRRGHRHSDSMPATKPRAKLWGTVNSALSGWHRPATTTTAHQGRPRGFFRRSDASAAEPAADSAPSMPPPPSLPPPPPRKPALSAPTTETHELHGTGEEAESDDERELPEKHIQCVVCEGELQISAFPFIWHDALESSSCRCLFYSFSDSLNPCRCRLTVPPVENEICGAFDRKRSAAPPGGRPRPKSVRGKELLGGHCLLAMRPILGRYTIRGDRGA